MRRSQALRVVAGAAAFAATAAVMAGCSSSKSTTTTAASATAKPKQGGIARVAEAPGTSPTAMWPFEQANQETTVNSGGFQEEMFRPLYYWGLNDQIALDDNVSPGNLPVYSNNDTTVAITLKPWKWSNGEAVDAQDVAFWINMAKAEEANDGTYTPANPSINAKYFPDDVKTVAVSGQTITLTLDSAVNEKWFTDNELGTITPMPVAWDVTAANTPGKCSTDTFGSPQAATDCAAVWKYMSAQSIALASFATNPLWQIVDGPWKIKTFNASDGAFSWVPNTSYSGPDKPYLDEVDFVSYTSDTAEYQDLKAGSTGPNALQIGYLPGEDLPVYNASNVNQGNPLTAEGYSLTQPSYLDEISYYMINFKNPAAGPLFKQGYFTTAVQETVDQNGITKAIAKGWGYPDNGVMASKPSGNPLSPKALASAGGNFNISAAKTLMQQNGWDVSTTPATCSNPGTGAGQCGAGIAKGAKAQFSLDYPSGSTTVTTEVTDMVSDAKQAGIQINANSKTQNAVGNEMVPCSTSTPTGCSWQGILYGGWVFVPDYYPTGEVLFATGAGSNVGSYSDPQADKLMLATTTDSNVQAMYDYEDYMSAHQPVIFLPNSFGSSEVAKGFHVDPGDPYQGVEPEYWYYTS